MNAVASEPPVVLVIGSINMDLVFTGLDLLPTPGQTVSSTGFRTMPGGKGANQASAAAKLGAEVHFVSAVGNDELGEVAMADLASRGIGLDYVAHADAATGVAGVLIENSGENVVIIAAGANATVGPDTVSAAERFVGRNVTVLACLEIPVETVTAWARVAREHGWTFILNPAPAQPLPVELLELVTVLTPNETELAPLGTVADMLGHGIQTVIVTRGGDGADLSTAEGTVHLPAFPAKPVDTTGAGDAFNGALAAALAEGQSMTDALAFASATGALSTRKVGARDALPTRDEVTGLIGA